MANDKNFKIKNGLLAGRYLGSNGTETVGSEGYGLSSGSYDGVSFSVAAQETVPYSVFFKPEGDKMYVMGRSGDDVNEYDLTTAWDISTASFLQSQSIFTQERNPTGLFFKPDGTKMYVSGYYNKLLHEYDLSTAWDVTSATPIASTGLISGLAAGLFFKPDGTKLYVCDLSTGELYSFDLSTAWDVSTRGSNQSFDGSTQEANPTGILFKPDGTKMYVTGTSNDDVNEYDLSTAWDITSASFLQAFSVAAQETSPNGLFFKPDGTKMFVVGQNSDTVFQYSTISYTQTLDLSTGTTFSFTPSGATAVSFTNAPASGIAIGFSVEIVGDGSAITWPSSVKWPSGVAPVALASKELYTFVTTDGGTTYYGKKAAEGIA